MNSGKKIFTTSYDLGGNPVGRLARLCALAKYLPIGNLRGGPGLRWLMTMLLLHTFGRGLFGLIIRQEQRLHRLYQLRHTLRRR